MSSFDELIQQKANNHHGEVPPGAWDKIMPPKKKKRKAYWWLFPLVALLFIGIGFLMVQQKAATNSSNTEAIAQVNTKKIEEQAVQKNTKESAQATSANSNKLNAANNSTNSLTQQQVSTPNKTVIANKIGQKKYPTSIKDNTQKLLKNNKASLAQDAVAQYKPVNKKTKGKLRATLSTNQAEENQMQQEESKKEEIITATNNQTEIIKQVETKELVKTESVPSNNATTNSANNSKEEKPTIPTVTNTNTKKSTPKASVFVDFSVAPMYPLTIANKNILLERTTTTGNANTQFKSNSIQATIQPTVAFEMAVRKKINAKWQIGVGLQYVQLKESISITGQQLTTTFTPINRLVMVGNQPTLVPDTVTTITSGVQAINAQNSYQFISVPVFAQYQAGSFLGCTVSLVGGVYVNVYHDYSNAINPLLTNNATNNNLAIDVFTAIKVSKKINKKIELFAEPAIRYGLQSVGIKNSLIPQKIHQTSMLVGFSFLLKGK